MPHTNRKFLLAYTLLVGLPVLGLIGILKSGRSLTAPISIDGLWQLQLDPARLSAIPCVKPLGETEPTILISQSGKNFSLSFSGDSKSTSSGVLLGNTLTTSVSSPLSSSEPGCREGHELSLIATVDPKSDPRSMVGRLSITRCDSCASLEFHAIRQASPLQRKGSH